MAADGTIVLKTEIDESGLKNGLSSLKSGLGAVGTAGKAMAAGIALVGAAAVTATTSIVAGAKATAEYGDRVDKLSQKIGMSAESFQQWDYILQINGASIDGLQMSMKTLSNAAQSGAAEFQKLGMSEEFVKSASPEELFEATITSLQGMEESTERTAIASKLLGRSATELAPLLNSDAESIEELKKQAIDYGMVMSDEAVKASAAFQDSLTTLSMTTTGLKNKMMSEFLPALTSVTDGLALLMTGDMSGLDQINAGIDGFVDKISEILPRVIEIGGSILLNLGKAILSKLPSLLQRGVEIVVYLTNAIIQALPNLISAVITALPTLIQTLVSNLPIIIPLLINGLVQCIIILVQNLPQIIQPIIDNLPLIITSITGALIDNLPILIQGAIQLVIALVAALPQIIAALLEAMGGVAQQIGAALFNALPEPVKNAFEQAWELIKTVWDQVAPYFNAVWESIKAVFSVVKDVLGAAFEVAWTAIKAVWDTVSGYFRAIWDTIAGIFSVVKDVLTGNWSDAWEGIKGIVQTWADFFKGVWESIKGVFSAVADFFRTCFESAWEGIKGIVNTWVDFFSGVWGGIKGVFSSVSSFFSSAFTNAWNAIKNAWSGVTSFFSGIWTQIKNAFKFSEMGAVGRNIVQGLWNGISGAKDWLLGKIQAWCGSILNGIKSFFGIASPSRVMRDEVGKMIPKGMAIGINQAKNLVTKATKSLVEDTRTELMRVLDDMNVKMLKSEKTYAEESLRIEREKEEKEYQDKLKAAKTEEERLKVVEERQLKIQERQQQEYLDNLKKVAETERKIYDARQKDIQDAQNNIVKMYENAANEILDSIEDLQKRQQTLADKLSDFGSIMEDVTQIEDKFSDIHEPFYQGKTGRYFLEDLTQQTEELEMYYEALSSLRDRKGMSEELFNVIKNMGYDDSLIYTQKLMKLNDDQFTKYIEDWQKKQETSQRITNELFGEDGKVSAQRVLSDLSAQTDTLKQYYNMLEAVKNRADVPKEFFAALRDMGVEEGLEYANALLELSDADFAQYINDWKEKEKTSQLISKELYRDEADALSDEIEDKFNKVKQSFFDIGKDAAGEWEQGFLAQLNKAIKNIKNTVENAFSGVTLGSYGGDFSVSVPGLARGAVLPPNREFLAVVGDQKSGTNIEAPLDTIVEAMNIALANRNVSGNTEVILEVDGREFGRAVVEQGNKENRRIGTRLVMA